jgi:NAD(P)-dependent dehydrogenase (short-subunit alcohol dehydrogenase family)
VTTLFEAVAAELGAVTHLVNNAGIVDPNPTLAEVDGVGLQKLFATNVVGPLICCREAQKWMTGGGAIVNVSSGSAYVPGSPAR